jgi:CBS domain-containing protein
MVIRDCMKRDIISISSSMTIREAAMLVVERHIGLLPVIDDEDKLIGVVGLHDLLTLELPDFVNFIPDVDFVHDFGAVETTRPDSFLLERPVSSLMQPAISVDEDCGLLRSYALMLQHQLLDLPVVSNDGKLVGLASRVDICAAVLAGWKVPPSGQP